MSPVNYPVIFIENRSTRLYGELIQQIEARNTCWLRPLSICTEEATTGKIALLDVRDGPDLICSKDLIRPALDVEWLHLLDGMSRIQHPCNYVEANKHLRHFLKELQEAIGVGDAREKY